MDLCGFTNIEMVVFDKDGTLIDLHTFWSEVIRRRASALVNRYRLPQKEHSKKVLADIMGLDNETGRLKPEGPVGIVGRDQVIDAVVSGFADWFAIRTTGEEIAVIFDCVHAEFVPVMSDLVFIPLRLSFP